VIKPALIGLYGPWISGGVEFNWPQHHRPSTFDPTHFSIEAHPDGSKTVWMSEHEPLNRTKGMVGICLAPGKAYVETKVRLYNRTPFPQTFLWWANAGVKINDRYQVIFPPDVHYAVYHVKNPVTTYPIAKGPFTYGLDYGEGTDVSYWANSPQASSFFAAPSRYEFFGGYDHERGAGVVHLADAGISPGKKFFTWGNGGFGHQWQRNLRDASPDPAEDTGEYLELMAGVYTDNQPDFSWIMPYETRTFSQFWYPIQNIGGIKNANLRAAVNLEVTGDQAAVGVNPVEVIDNARITLTAGTRQVLLDESIDLAPGQPYRATAALPRGVAETDLLLRVQDTGGAEIIRYQPEPAWDGRLPEPFKAPPTPAEVAEIEQLYLIGLHLEQYRHPTLAPEIYWQEALRRDPGESRVNLVLGKGLLRRGLLAEAEAHFRASVGRLTAWNFNPYDGEAHYNLGLCLQYQGRLDEAYPAFYKAAWNYAWQSAAYYALAQIDLLRQDVAKALDHLERAWQVNAHSSKIRNLKSTALRRAGQPQAAAALAEESLALDPLDFWAMNEIGLANPDRREEMRKQMLADPQTRLDIAFDYAAAGFFAEACDLLEPVGSSPMAAYTLGWLYARMGVERLSARWYGLAAKASPDYCFPWRLEEMILLQAALDTNPADPRAPYYLGNLLYDKRRSAEAVALWRRATELDPNFSIPWRNLGLAAANQDKDLDAALTFFRRALEANPTDPRLLLEYDHLLSRKAVSPEERLARLESNLAVTDLRDDLTVRRMALHNRLGRPQKTLEIASARLFHAWEGGEGSVAGQYSNAHWMLGRQALESGDTQAALEHFQAGLQFPENLGEHPFEATYVHLVYYKGLALVALDQAEQARAAFKEVRAMFDTGGWVGLFKALARVQLGEAEAGRADLLRLKREAEAAAHQPFAWNYFYSGNPNPTFEEDYQELQRVESIFLAGLAAAFLGDTPGAKSALGQVLAADPANLIAWEEFRRLG